MRHLPQSAAGGGDGREEKFFVEGDDGCVEDADDVRKLVLLSDELDLRTGTVQQAEVFVY